MQALSEDLPTLSKHMVNRIYFILALQRRSEKALVDQQDLLHLSSSTTGGLI